MSNFFFYTILRQNFSDSSKYFFYLSVIKESSFWTKLTDPWFLTDLFPQPWSNEVQITVTTNYKS